MRNIKAFFFTAGMRVLRKFQASPVTAVFS
jgi:hypothetical protein